MSSTALILLILLYLGLLFFIAYRAERRRGQFWINNPYVYSLSLAVYCTAWTYYGSIGVAANQGLEYMSVYIGPVIIIPLWIYINTKIVRISRVNKISSLADFISLRYGNGRSLGALVAVVCILAIIPYIGLQIKAISESFHQLSQTRPSDNIFFDTATYIVLLIAIFSSYYGTRYVDASEKRLGIISAVATESILKIVFFIVLGLFTVFIVFDGIGDIYTQASKLPDFRAKNTINGLEGAFNWLIMLLLSMSAMFVLPRQFHTAIVENRKEKHIKTAIWLLPLYLLAFNVFVFPIAWGGRVIFNNDIVNPELFSILIPQKLGYPFISVIVFLGGVSASVSMIIISSISLSVMLSNNIIIPYGWLEKFKLKTVNNNIKSIVNIRKISILLLILLAFLFYKYLIVEDSLFSIGLVSFVVVSQLLPSFLGALYWRRGNYKGAVSGILTGVCICYISLIIPTYFPELIIKEGHFLFWITFLKIPYLTPISNTVFWSLLANGLLFVIISTFTESSYRERNFAEIYVNIEDYSRHPENAYIWRGTAQISDIRKILVRFLGEQKTQQALKIFSLKYNVQSDSDAADARFIKFSENLLSGRIGTASAKILIEGVAKEDKITLPEVFRILEESRENISRNKQLTEQSHQLQKLSEKLQDANKNLILKDQQKDEFLDSVAHELRTPITAIRATSELLLDDEDMPAEIKKEFLENIISESDRLAEIINDILYLDKLEAGTVPLKINIHSIVATYQKAVKPLLHLLEQKQLHHSKINLLDNEMLSIDENKMIQVFQNIVGNALKFASEQGMIQVKFQEIKDFIRISIFNTGKAIPEEDLPYIFDKFYQSKNQNYQKPSGSGLGLAISKNIIHAHGGNILARNKETGVLFEIYMPTKPV